MEARELRIVNYLFFEETVVRVVEILENSISVSGYKGYITHIDTDNINLNPIELTEEILLKCGFIVKNNNQFIKNTLLIENSLNGFESRLISVKGYSYFIRDIKHLHQLQNLYYALTGNELEVCLT